MVYGQIQKKTGGGVSMTRTDSKKALLVVGLSIFFFLSTLALPQLGRAQAQNVLKFGSLIPLMLKEGVEIKKWHELFAKMINEQGGLTVGGKKYTLEFFAYDVGYMDSAKTLAAVQKAIHQDGVKYLVDNFGDMYSLTAVHADQNKVLCMGVGFGDEVVSTKYQYFFRPLGGQFTSATNYLLGKDFIKKGAKTGVVVTVDNEIGHVAAVQYGGGEAMAGLKMHEPIFFGMDTVDYGPIATKIKSLNVDVVDLGVSAGDQVVSLIAALKDVGWKGFMFPGAGINPTTFNNIVKRVGPYFDGSEMLFTDPRFIPIVANDPEMKALIDRYTKEYGEFHTEGCLWLSAWFTLKDAMMAAQSVDPTVLKDFIAKGQLTPLTLTGYCVLFARPDINQFRAVDGCTAAGRGVVKNGKLEYVGQMTAKDNYIATIKLHKQQDVYQKYWDKYGKPKFPNEPSTLDFPDLNK
jgi:branched-chain amino acid transport system substrate-binding protein